MKTCTGCGIEKPLNMFSKNKFGRQGLQPKCKACLLEQQRKRRKEKGDDTTYRYRYGKTAAELKEALQEQNNCCAICGTEFTESFDRVVDHNHETNKFRAWLCRKCNSGLGMFRDSLDYLEKAKQYLIKHANS